MRRLVANTLLGCGLLLAAGSSIHAQPYAQPYNRGGYRAAFFDRLQADLSRAANNGYLRGGDLRKFQQANKEIGEFQQKWSRGRYDRHELDDAIAATQRVANLRDIQYRDRAAINEDLARMRDFRARMSYR